MRGAEIGRPLIKFNHCKKYIYGFSVPESCPLCGRKVGSRRLEEAPVSISNPFTNGHQEKCSFLLKPTQGTFLRSGYDSTAWQDLYFRLNQNHKAETILQEPFIQGTLEASAYSYFMEYDGRSDLHVGITNTKGVVYNYNARGVHRDGAGWEQSLSIPLLQPNMFGLLDRWDQYLEVFSASGAWLPHRYKEDHHNCYSFTLTFINSILTTEGKKQLDKDEFTEKYVVPRTRKASKYITLYRAIEEHAFYMVDHPAAQTDPL